MKTRRLTKADIDRAVTKAIARIPEEIRDHLKNVVISIQKRPSKDIREEMGLGRHETLLGVYRGTSLRERTALYPPLYPDTIILFQEPLEEMCETLEELEDEIEITLVHEVAHFLGMSEERLAELGYG
ncbi:MAG TPA: metallopeptidase family protein [Syntrophales bacterium]|nr:metallopeptidase family protein [Syntrophales bacterium]